MLRPFFMLVLLLIFTLLFSAKMPATPTLADRVLVEKARRTLTLFGDNKALKVYSISLGPNSIGAKIQEGDGKTPEGIYKIDWRNPKSKYHLSLHINYPNETDRARAKALGVPPGGEIMIHGLPTGMKDEDTGAPKKDWTIGCIAVTNAEIEEIWAAVPNGTPIEIRP